MATSSHLTKVVNSQPERAVTVVIMADEHSVNPPRNRLITTSLGKLWENGVELMMSMTELGLRYHYDDQTKSGPYLWVTLPFSDDEQTGASIMADVHHLFTNLFN